MSMYALTTTQGTAMSETAICGGCFTPEAKARAIFRAESDKSSNDFADCTGNEVLECNECGNSI